MKLISLNLVVGSLIQTRHLFRVTPGLISFTSEVELARRISPSIIAIRCKYERNSLPSADLKLWPIKPSSPDSTNADRFR